MRTICLSALALVMFGACGQTSNDGSDAAEAADSAGDTPSAAVDVVPEIGVELTLVVDVKEVESAGPDASDITPDTEPEDMGPGPVECNGALGSLPEGLLELGRDDGGEFTSMAQQVDWTVLDQSTPEATLYEAQRFDLEHPAVVHGFSIRYGYLPEGTDLPVTAGLYPDMGNNGFDFWQFEPYFEGTRCRGDFEPGDWVTYVLDEPIEFPHPVPVYVAHLRHGNESAAWAFDLSLPDGCENPSECCGPFDACASAWNFPEMTDFVIDGQPYFNWNGLSLTFAYDYMVHLHVEYTDDVAPDEHFFKKVESGPAPGVHLAWGDFDNDGWDDLLGGTVLYRNNEGHFEDVSDAAGLSGVAASGGTFGDYDNDGCLDILVYHESYTGFDRLFHNNCDGTFTETTQESGISDLQSYNLCTGDLEVEAAPSNHAAWVDIDGDSLLDLYVTNYICWATWTSYPDNIWHNEGDGTFSEWMGTHGFLGENSSWSSGRGANPIDYDFDGDMDIMVNNYHLHKNLFYENNGDGTVTEKAAKLGVHGHADFFQFGVNYGHSCGVSWGDMDNDGDWDMVIANLAHPRFYNFSDKTQVLMNDGTGHFEDLQGDWSYPMGDAGIRYQEGHYVPVLADIDQDGVLDLAISSEYNGRPTGFYWGQGDGTFRLDTYHAGIKMPTGNCMAVSDIDHDGDMDMGTRAAIWRNELTDDAKGHWLQIRPLGTATNAAAIGATVRIFAGETMYLRYVNGGTGQGCQDSMYVHVGLGDVDKIDLIEVDYPYTTTVSYPGPVDADQRLWLTEDGDVHAGWAPPL